MMSNSTPSDFLFTSSEDAYSVLKNDLNQYDHWVLLMDDHTMKHCKSNFLQKLGLDPKLELCIMPGEQNKSLEVCQNLWTEMLEKGIDRNAALLNLGGGLISDLGGYVAACYKRGIDFYNVPTTLLSMVDAAYGGKTAVNLSGIKNQIGVFKEAKKVLFDTDYLKSLPELQLISGFGEIMKHALIDDAKLWDRIKSADKILDQDLEYYIQSSIKVKTSITEKDPFEKNIRKKLNFGHSIGHAFEALFVEDTGVFHGHSVAAGMICESYISMKSGLLSEDSLNEVLSVILQHFGKLDFTESDDQDLLKSLFFDKKNTSDQLNFTLISKIGEAVIDQFISEQLVIDSLKYYRQLR